MTRNTTTDAMTGNLPDDHDYDFCKRYGLMTIDSQRRNYEQLHAQDLKRNAGDWFKNSSAFTGEGD